LESRRGHHSFSRKDSMPTDIITEVESFRTLEQAMLWAFSRTPPAHLVSVVTQDEFTHDVLIRVSADTFLVFDTT
jgi:hypothetical protein